MDGGSRTDGAPTNKKAPARRGHQAHEGLVIERRSAHRSPGVGEARTDADQQGPWAVAGERRVRALGHREGDCRRQRPATLARSGQRGNPAPGSPASPGPPVAPRLKAAVGPVACVQDFWGWPGSLLSPLESCRQCRRPPPALPAACCRSMAGCICKVGATTNRWMGIRLPSVRRVMAWRRAPISPTPIAARPIGMAPPHPAMRTILCRIFIARGPACAIAPDQRASAPGAFEGASWPPWAGSSPARIDAQECRQIKPIALPAARSGSQPGPGF